MILRMEKAFVCVHSDNHRAVLDALMKLGCVQIANPDMLPDGNQLLEETTRASSDVYASEQQLNKIKAGINTILPYAKKKAIFDKKPVVAYEDLYLRTKDALALCDEIEHIKNEMTQNTANRSKLVFETQALDPWKNLDIRLSEINTDSCSVELVTIPTDHVKDLSDLLEDSQLAVYTESVNSDERWTYLAVLYYRADSEAITDILRKAGGTKPAFQADEDTIEKCIEKRRQEIASLDKHNEFLLEMLREKGKSMDVLQLAYDATQAEISKAQAKSLFLKTEKTALIAAWVPTEDKEKLTAVLDQYGCYYEFFDPEEGEEAPVKLKNNKLVEPYEVVTDMYSVPSYNGIDPNALMAPFFFLFFGMMLSEAGYGILMVIGGLIALKKMDLGETAKKFMKLIVQCGISTTLVGFAYGSFFGDAIPVVTETFFGNRIELPYLLDPLKEPLVLLIISLALGVVHLFFGMGVSGYMMIKRGHPWDAVFDIGFWYLFLSGLILWIAGGYLWAGATEIGKIIAIVGAVGLVLTQGRSKKGIFGKIFGGLYSLYNVTSYFSDILSYSRVLALGLATGVIAQVVNLLAVLITVPVVRIIAFFAIFLFGHALNLGINALGAYVHTARLQYVEYYGKFFEGGGTKFVPFAPKTKYVNIKTSEE